MIIMKGRLIGLILLIIVMKVNLKLSI